MAKVKGIFWITSIPDVMENLNLPFSAYLQRHWFSGSAFELTDEIHGTHWSNSTYYTSLPPSRCLDLGETKVVNPAGGASLGSVDWAFGFNRPYSRYARFRASLLNATIDSFSWKIPRKRIRDRLKEIVKMKGYKEGQAVPFGSDLLPARYQIDHFDIVAEQVRLLPPQLKPCDFEASYGGCSWNATIVATAVPVGPALYEVRITDVGFFLSDNFEFNGVQPLGAWSRSDVVRLTLWGVWPEIAFKQDSAADADDNGYYFASNSTYRDYRKNNDKGCDFHLFSDVGWVKVDPERFRFVLTTAGD